MPCTWSLLEIVPGCLAEWPPNGEANTTRNQQHVRSAPVGLHPVSRAGRPLLISVAFAHHFISLLLVHRWPVGRKRAKEDLRWVILWVQMIAALRADCNAVGWHSVENLHSSSHHCQASLPCCVQHPSLGGFSTVPLYAMLPPLFPYLGSESGAPGQSALGKISLQGATIRTKFARLLVCLSAPRKGAIPTGNERAASNSGGAVKLETGK